MVIDQYWSIVDDRDIYWYCIWYDVDNKTINKYKKNKLHTSCIDFIQSFAALPQTTLAVQSNDEFGHLSPSIGNGVYYKKYIEKIYA